MSRKPWPGTSSSHHWTGSIKGWAEMATAPTAGEASLEERAAAVGVDDKEGCISGVRPAAPVYLR